MKANEGTLDRGLRVVLGASLAGMAFLGIGSGVVTGVMAVVGVVLVVTGLVGFCPAYRLIGVSTCSTKG